MEGFGIKRIEVISPDDLPDCNRSIIFWLLKECLKNDCCIIRMIFQEKMNLVWPQIIIYCGKNFHSFELLIIQLSISVPIFVFFVKGEGMGSDLSLKLFRG